jgi:hypothetical protein
MKNAYRVLITLVLLVCLSGCSQSSGDAETNPLTGKIYMHNTPLEQSLDLDYVKFYDDNTFQGVKVSSFQKDQATGKTSAQFVSSYGTYEISDNALTFNLSDNSFSGVILDDGSSIKFGTDEFIDYTSQIKDSDPILSEFR